MEKPLFTVFGRHESEKTIEKSRFFTYSAHVESEEEAKAFLSEIRRAHSLAHYNNSVAASNAALLCKIRKRCTSEGFFSFKA